MVTEWHQQRLILHSIPRLFTLWEGMISRCGEISLRQEEQLLVTRKKIKSLLSGARGNGHVVQRISEDFIFSVKLKLRSFPDSQTGGTRKGDLKGVEKV